MADKFDISEHVKVEALGVRVAEVVSETEIEVNGKLYNSANYTLTPSGLNVSTELLPLDDMDVPYIVDLDSTNARIYWTPEAGASYRWYLGSSSTPGSYTTITNTRVTVSTGTSTSTSYFKVQVNRGSGWVDLIARPNGSTYAYARSYDNIFGAGYHYPNTSSTSVTGYLEGTGPTSDADGLVEYDSTRYLLTFSSTSITNVDKFLIGIAPTNDPYPQYHVEPRGLAYLLSGNTSYIVVPYQVLIPKEKVDPASAKISVSLLDVNTTTTLLDEITHGPELISDHVDTSTTLQLKREIGDYETGTNLSFEWGYHYANLHNGDCSWVRDSRTQLQLTNNFGNASVGYAIYHENRATDTFGPSDDLKTTGTLAGTYDSRTITSTTLADTYFDPGYNKFAIYPLIYTDYTATTGTVTYYSLNSSNYVPSITIRKSDYKAILTMEFKNWPNNWTGLRVLGTWFENQGGTQVPQTLISQTTAIPDNTTVEYVITEQPDPINSYNMLYLLSWNGSSWVTIGEFQIISSDIYEIGDTPYGSQTVYTYNENYTYGVASLGSGTYELSFVNETAGELYYLGATLADKYPLYKFTVPAAGVVKVDMPNLPADFVLQVMHDDAIVDYTIIVGDPYSSTYDETYYAYGWWPLQCSVSNVDIESSYNEERGLLKTPEPGSCSLTLKGDEGDPRVNTAIQLDAKIRVKLAAAASPDNSEDYLFSGFLDTMSTTYDTLGNAITTLSCVTAMSRVLNVNIPLYEVASQESFSDRMFRVLDTYVAPATWGVAYDDSLYELLQPYDGSVFPPEYRENVSASDIINELTEGEYAVMAQSRAGVIFWFNRAAPAIFADSETLTSQPNWYGFSTEHNNSVDHFCISDFTIENSMDDINNKIVASITYDELTTATFADQDSIDRYGERSYEVQLNLYTPAGNATQYLDSWLAEVPYIEDRSELRSITTNVVNYNGYVTRAYQTDITLDLLRVYIKTGPVDINGVWYAKRISHNITPEGWTMTLDLTAN